MSSSDANSLHRQIRESEARLAELDTERAETERRLSELRGKLAQIEPSAAGPPVPSPDQPPRSKNEKVTLFRTLFVGRVDVFPRLWRNARTKKQGYAPACANEWVQGVCEKPRVKCGECPSQAFLEVTDRALLDHLQGRHVMGVYPLLKDEACCFLAVDFDQGGWREDVAAYVATAQRLGVTPAVERSRSGDGAHVWFFFSAPVSASAARKMGSYMLTEAMASRPELPMTSYDRLFPNQDTMPRGGFGSLIALPLQYQPRKRGNTVFVDKRWEPFPDQWAYLAALPRLSPSKVEDIAKEASARGRVMGVSSIDVVESDTEAPWLRSPSAGADELRVEGPLPSEVQGVLAQQLYLEKRGLPPSLVDRIMRLAAFQNSQFYEKQAMRLSTALTPRVISCAEDLKAHVSLPRGCVPALERLLEGQGIRLCLVDERTDGEPIDLRFRGTLTELQEEAARALLSHETGVFVAPPGMGKTVVGAHLIAKRGLNTLVIVHRTPLLDQWWAQLCAFLDLKPAQIGQVGGGKRKVTGEVDVAMIQSLVRRDQVNPMVADYGHIIVDECHHVPAVSFERVMREVRARFVMGLTATPRRRDGHHPILEFQIGPVRFSVDSRQLAAGRPFGHRVVVRETGFRLPGTTMAPGIQEIYRQLVEDHGRNDLILDDLLSALEAGRSPMLLTERRDHLEFFAERLRRVARNVLVLKGGTGTKARRRTAEKLSQIPDSEERVLLATGRFIGEGFDDSRLDTLFLALPIAWKGTLVQYAGRLHRRHKGKTEVRIFDYVDRGVPVLARMFEKRLRGYGAMGYELDDATPHRGGRAEAPTCPAGREAGREAVGRLLLVSIVVSIGGFRLLSMGQVGEQVAREVRCLCSFLSRML